MQSWAAASVSLPGQNTALVRYGRLHFTLAGSGISRAVALTRFSRVGFLTQLPRHLDRQMWCRSVHMIVAGVYMSCNWYPVVLRSKCARRHPCIKDVHWQVAWTQTHLQACHNIVYKLSTGTVACSYESTWIFEFDSRGKGFSRELPRLENKNSRVPTVGINSSRPYTKTKQTAVTVGEKADDDIEEAAWQARQGLRAQIHGVYVMLWKELLKCV